MDLRNNKAFSLAEMMIVMLVLSIVMAASMPIITKRARASTDKIWNFMGNHSDVFAVTGDNQRAAIGISTLPDIAIDNARFIINTSGPTQDQMIFKEKAEEQGRLIVNSNCSVGLGAAVVSSARDATAIGESSSADADGATALGTSAGANHPYATALGGSARAFADHAIALGVNSYATGARSIAIGIDNSGASYGARADNAVAMGNLAYANADSAIALGNSSIASGNNSIAIGIGNTGDTYGARANKAIAIGFKTAATGDHTVALGDGASAAGTNSIAIGADVTAGPNQIVLGTSNQTVIIPGKLYLPKYVSGDAYVINGELFIFPSPSDRRLKNIKGEFIGGLDKIRQIKTYNYTFKKDKKKQPRVGVIAQDLQKVFPNAVTKDEKGYLLIRQDDMFYAMINSIKQLDKIVQGIVKDFKALLARVKQIDEKIIALIKTDKITGQKIKQLEKQNKALEARLKRLEISKR